MLLDLINFMFYLQTNVFIEKFRLPHFAGRNILYLSDFALFIDFYEQSPML